jgi:hypothetical protein
MSDARIAPRGVVAPYGEWNQNLEQALAELGFEYSSEFGYAYDDLPARPGTSRGPGKVMQVPVHPVSAGRLIAARAVNREIVSYYQTIIDEQVARREPCFLYDHPTQVARMPEVWAEVLEYGRVRCGGAVTLTDYASWWRRRESINLTVKPLPNGIEFAAAPAHADVSLVVEVGDRRAELPLRSGQYDLDRLVWTSAPEPVRPDPLVSELRRSSLRLTLREWRRSVEKHLQSGRG